MSSASIEAMKMGLANWLVGAEVIDARLEVHVAT
jgi:hypothetical protein